MDRVIFSIFQRCLVHVQMNGIALFDHLSSFLVLLAKGFMIFPGWLAFSLPGLFLKPISSMEVAICHIPSPTMSYSVTYYVICEQVIMSCICRLTFDSLLVNHMASGLFRVIAALVSHGRTYVEGRRDSQSRFMNFLSLSHSIVRGHIQPLGKILSLNHWIRL